MSTPAPVYSLSTTPSQETIDFLRRLSSMLTGGRNAEMLQQAASLIETLSQRAAHAEQRFQEQQEDHARNLELREVAELASDNLLSEVDSLKAEIGSLKTQLDERNRHSDNLLAEAESLKAAIGSLGAQLDESNRQSDNLHSEVQPLKAEIDVLKAQVEERNRQADIDRNWFAEETLRAQAHAEQAQERLAAVTAELEELRKPPPEAIDESIAVVPVQSLQIARTQFDYLAKGFASKGDVVSQMICEIGVRALDKALDDGAPNRNTPAREAGLPLAPER